MAEKNEKEIKVKSLQKALDILNCFTKKSSWGVTELSEYLDLNKSNVQHPFYLYCNGIFKAG